jgi:hypothetical protein
MLKNVAALLHEIKRSPFSETRNRRHTLELFQSISLIFGPIVDRLHDKGDVRMFSCLHFPSTISLEYAPVTGDETDTSRSDNRCNVYAHQVHEGHSVTNPRTGTSFD